MDRATLIDRFLLFEHENRLFERMFSGFRYWHFLRFHLFENVIVRQLEGTELVRDELRLSDMPGFRRARAFSGRFLTYIRNSFGKRALRHLSRKDILFLPITRLVKEGGFNISPYIDTFLPHLRATYCVLEQPYQGRHFKPPGGSQVKYMDFALLGAGLSRFSRRITRRLPRDEEEAAFIRKLTLAMQSEFRVEISYEWLHSRIIELVTRSVCLAPCLEAALGEMKPRLIVEVCSDDNVHMLFTMIAKRLGITTVELQHGIINRYHVAYNFHEKQDMETFPDYILLFGSYWKENTRFPIDSERLIVTGFPYFEEKVKQYRKEKNRQDYPKTILFVSQGPIGKQLSRLAVELYDKLDKNRYRIIYKLHPGEYLRWKTKYSQLVGSGVEVVDNSEKSIYHYLNLAQHVVGVYSTVLFESMAFGSQILVAKLPGHGYVEGLYGRGYARLVSCAQDIIEGLEEAPPNLEGVSDEFWEPDAKEKMLASIEALLKLQR